MRNVATETSAPSLTEQEKARVWYKNEREEIRRMYRLFPNSTVRPTTHQFRRLFPNMPLVDSRYSFAHCPLIRGSEFN